MIGQGELRTPHASRRALTQTKTICPPLRKCHLNRHKIYCSVWQMKLAHVSSNVMQIMK